MSIEKYLDLSTTHILESDTKLVVKLTHERSAMHENPFVVYETLDYGWFIHAFPSEPEMLENAIAEWKKLGGSDALGALLRSAHDAGCTFLRLDRDGPIDNNFPAYDW